jgi:hypothetical protein
MDSVVPENIVIQKRLLTQKCSTAHKWHLSIVNCSAPWIGCKFSVSQSALPNVSAELNALGYVTSVLARSCILLLLVVPKIYRTGE